MPDLSARVAEAFRSLPSRYLGAETGFDATYHVRLGDIGRSSVRLPVRVSCRRTVRNSAFGAGGVVRAAYGL